MVTTLRGQSHRMKCLDDYVDIVGEAAIAEIYRKAKELQGRRVVHINSTNEGGGVAEILNSFVPLMNDIGIDTDWRVLHGPPDFFALTKKFHNALQGGSIDIDEATEELYVQTNEAFSAYCHVDADCVIVHDPQPLPLIRLCKKKQPWVWRCHVDLSKPNDALWEFLKRFILRYDLVVLSCEKYRRELPVSQRIISPAIDPLSAKNRDMSAEEIASLVADANIPLDKPFITQVSRMDQWKDPEGLLDVFERVREKVDCRLVYCYSSSVDDPEGSEVLLRTYRRAEALVETGDVLFVDGTSQALVNAIQRASAVVVQKSVREGFCLCITEALWKERPVVATNVGGIPLQLRQAENGFLVEPHDKEGFARKVVELLTSPEVAMRLGNRGRETVRENFLITRLIMDYLDLLADLWRRPC
jgi:trehalose synthase